MRKVVGFLAIISLVSIAGCKTDEPGFDGNASITSTIGSKYAVTPSKITVYNDVNSTYATVPFGDAQSAKLPTETKKIYAAMPTSSSMDGPRAVMFGIYANQTVDTDGKLDAYSCNMYATASLIDGKATLSFKPAGALIYFKLSHSVSFPERVSGLVFEPSDLTGLVGKQTLDLTSGDVRFTKGSSNSYIEVSFNAENDFAKTSAVTVPVVVPYKSLSNVKVKIQTSRANYYFNCGNIDMSNVGEKEISLNLSSAQEIEPVEDFITEDIIPDFSGVGYRRGEKEIPDVPVVATLTAPVDGADARALIQNAIDNASSPGAILLKAGRYNVDGSILLNRSGIVLRGEGQDEATGTIIYSTSEVKDGEELSLIIVGKQGGSVNYSETGVARMTESYVPCGRKSFLVNDASGYAVGDRIAIYRPGTQEWIHDLLMDQIPDSGDTKQWTPDSYNLYWERTITKIVGDRIYIDDPVVMSLDNRNSNRYGGGYIKHVALSNRIEECGIENMRIDSRFDPSKKDTHDGIEVYVDELHCWNAINVSYAEHSWVRNVTSIHMGCSAVVLNTGAKNITVQSCTSLEPVSIIDGSRRYAFNFAQPQLSLCINCKCDLDRHQFVTGARTCGPNAFVECKGTNAFSDAGPHHRWATGILWDCVETSKDLRVRDRGNSGTGHGWAGANCVLWNCVVGAVLQCDSPQVSAKNYTVGCVSADRELGRSFNGKDRPVGEWASWNEPVLSGEYYGAITTQKSLYRSQVANRNR